MRRLYLMHSTKSTDCFPDRSVKFCEVDLISMADVFLPSNLSSNIRQDPFQ